ARTRPGFHGAPPGPSATDPAPRRCAAAAESPGAHAPATRGPAPGGREARRSRRRGVALAPVEGVVGDLFPTGLRARPVRATGEQLELRDGLALRVPARNRLV